jgi:hypothetical protein
MVGVAFINSATGVVAGQVLDYKWKIKIRQIDCKESDPLQGKIYSSFENRLLKPAKFLSLSMIIAQQNALLCLSDIVIILKSEMSIQSKRSFILIFSAPPGCLQYYSDPVGTIESFNFRSFEGIYPVNLDYSICVKKLEGFGCFSLTTLTTGDGTCFLFVHSFTSERLWTKLTLQSLK